MREAVRLKRVMYRHYSKDQNAETHERMKAANRDCNKIIAQAKKDHWIAFAGSISAGKADLGSVWKKIRRMKQQCVVPDSDLQHGSTKYTTCCGISLRPVTPTVSRQATIPTRDGGYLHAPGAR